MMKSKSSEEPSTSNSIKLTTSNSGNRIKKVSRSERQQRKRTMAKLQRMVPTAKKGVSELDLLNHVMEYIHILQEILKDDDNNLNAENRHPNIDVTVLSQMLERFTTNSDGDQKRMPLQTSMQIY